MLFKHIARLCTNRTVIAFFCSQPKALRSKKPKSTKETLQHFVDIRKIRAIGGTGGNGCISFLQLWSNEHAGPDGGDGGNGGHVILQASNQVKDLSQLTSLIKAEDGEKGYNKDCHGKNAPHYIVDVPIGTVIKNNQNIVVGDLDEEGSLFIAAHGGSGGRGNHFFVTETHQSPKISECGACGEDLLYTVELKSMAHVGLIGFPNAGKSTLLSAISRARPKVASYPFTTLKPHLGVIQYDDYEQIAVADLPGLIADSHLNKGLGIQFLKHVERCSVLIYVIDVSLNESWIYLEQLQYELSKFSPDLLARPQIVIANKMDLAHSNTNLNELTKKTDMKIIPVSAKFGNNLSVLLQEIRNICIKNS